MHQKPCRLTRADKYYFGGAPEVPQQHLGPELGSILSYLPKFTQKQFSLSGQYGKKFAEQDIKTSQTFAPQYAQLGLNLAKQFAPAYLGVNLGQMAKNIAGQPLLKGLNEQANRLLGQQGQLTPQEAYQDTQASLQPFAGRNNVFNQAEATAFLNRDALVRQRANEARQLAMGVQGLNLQQLSGLQGVAQMPNLAAYGAPGASYAPMAAGLGATSGQANSLLGFGQNLFDANQNAAATQNIAGANKSAGLTGAGIGAIGTLGAAAIGL